MSDWKDRFRKAVEYKEKEVQFRRNLHIHNRNRSGLSTAGSGPEADSINKVDLCRPILENDERDHPRWGWCMNQKLDDERRAKIRKESHEKATTRTEMWQLQQRLKRANNHLRKPERNGKKR